jgi:Spy/CpxP family protein refolding chaperone
MSFKHVSLQKIAFPLLWLSIGLAGAPAALGQMGGQPLRDGRPMPMQHGSNVDSELQKITELLTLTEDQKASMKAVLLEYNQKMDDVFRKYLGNLEDPEQPPQESTRRAMHDAFKSVHVATYAKIDGILNRDQRARFAAWKREHQRSLGHRDDMPPPLDELLGGPEDHGMRDDEPPSR